MLPAVILCGGRGRRFRPALADCPKVLAKIKGVPFLDFLLRSLYKQGVTKVILSTGYLGDQIKAFVGDGSRWPLSVQCIREEIPLGTAGGLRYAVERAGVVDSFLVMNGDTFFSGSLQELVRFHNMRQNAAGTLALVQMQNPGRYGTVQFEPKSMRVLDFKEKSVETNERVWISAGVYVLEQLVLQPIVPNVSISLEHDIFPEWTEKGLYGCLFPEATFLDIGTPQDYLRSEEILSHL